MAFLVVGFRYLVSFLWEEDDGIPRDEICTREVHGKLCLTLWKQVIKLTSHHYASHSKGSALFIASLHTLLHISFREMSTQQCGAVQYEAGSFPSYFRPPFFYIILPFPPLYRNA